MNVLSSHNQVFDGLSFEKVAPIAERIMQGFAAGEFDKVVVVYNRFKNAAVQIPTEEQFLPVLPPEKSAVKTSAIDYIFEPNKEEIVRELIPKEHGARMTAMKKATDNAKELLKELRLSYNKARQAAITNEILEIVGGAEALKG
jgi:F-type H+-transporting ATPase subunit gamma